MTLLPVYWLHPPSKWLHPRHSLGLSACLGQQRFRAGAVGGAFNYRVSLSATATGHPTPSEAGVRCCREAERLPATGKRIAGCLKDRRESGRGLWRQQGGIFIQNVSLPVTGNAEGGCLCHAPVCAHYTGAGSWEAGQWVTHHCGSPLSIERPHRLTPCPTGLCQADLLFWYSCWCDVTECLWSLCCRSL